MKIRVLVSRTKKNENQMNVTFVVCFCFGSLRVFPEFINKETEFDFMSTSGSAEGIQLIADERSFLRIVPAMVISRWKVLSLLVLQTEICERKKKKKVDSIFPFEQKMIELTFL